MDREVESTLAMLNNPWGDGTSIKCITETWKRSKLFKRADHVTVQPILAAVNAKIWSANEKIHGLKLLLQIAESCSESCLNEYGAQFVLQAARSCDKHNSYNVRCCALLILKRLANRAGKIQPMVKAITGNGVAQVLDALNESSPDLKLYACHALYSILTHFSSSCGSVKATLEQRLAEILVMNNEWLALFAARCFARLPLIGGGGVGQQGHQAAVTCLLKKTIAALHLELDGLYEGVHELPMTYPLTSKENLGLPPVSEIKPAIRLQKIERRLKCLCIYLSALLLEPMPISKAVPVQDIFGLVCRAIGVTGTSLGTSQLIEVLVLRDLIPSVHISFMSVMESLIEIGKTNLLLYNETFYHMIINCLSWTQKKKDNQASYNYLRRKVYSMLSCWLSNLKGASGVETFADRIVPHVFQNITPEKEAVVLKAVKQTLKRKKGRVADQSSAVPNETSTQRVYDEDLCSAGLEAMILILKSAGSLIKSSFHKAMQELVVALLVDLQRGLDPHPLYSSEKCQLQLYESLQSLILFPHPLCPPATIYATTLFSCGQLSKSKEISRFCQQAMQVVQRLSFPVYPSIVLESEVLEDLKDQAIANAAAEEESEEEEEEEESADEEVQVRPEAVSVIVAAEPEPSEPQPPAASKADRPDSDLEVLKEIFVMAVPDAASSENDDEEQQRPEEITINDVVTAYDQCTTENDIELIAEQPTKKARIEVLEKYDDVALMLADLVE
ncbi:Hypothetical predicted protein [Cloeon dipterum]|uniref:Pre-rRNA-processing protein RIX1 N-terminal domain-containing protein n=1 Tax=Cloeon dipterum TaxID=197152 RepID=A0A8S1BP58_9INSE|nr:Hypothetical predicted protein [Cloeon dipterum]